MSAFPVRPHAQLPVADVLVAGVSKSVFSRLAAASRPRSSFLVTTQICLVALSSMAPGFAEVRDEGKVVVELESAKEEYFFGENIVVTVNLANNSGRPIALRPSESLGREPCIRISRNASGLRPLNHELFIGPGAFIVDTGSRLSFRLPGYFLPLGEHAVKMQWVYREIDTEMPGYDGGRRGSATSAPLRIVVRPYDEGRDKESLTRQKNLLASLVANGDVDTLKQLQGVLVRYLPLTSDFITGCLGHEAAALRASTVSSLSLLAAEEADAEQRQRVSSLTDHVLRLGRTEEDASVKTWVAIYLGNAGEGKSTRVAPGVCKLLDEFLYDESPQVVLHAMRSYVRLDPKGAAQAIRKKIGEDRRLDRLVRATLVQILLKRTGTHDIAEGLKRLEVGTPQRDEK